MMHPRNPKLSVATALVALMPGCRFLSGYADGDSTQLAQHRRAPQSGFHRLLFDDFHGLSTDAMQRSALPYKVVGAALLLHHGVERPSREALSELLSRRYGFVLPARVANAPDGASPTFTHPLGLVSGTVARSWPTVELEVVNTGCSTCHSAALRDASGAPTRDVWVGLPSSDVNLERYVVELHAALTDGLARKGALLETLRTAFPEVSADELASIRDYVLPPLAKRLKELAAIGRFTPYSNGGAGVTNGAATVQYYLGWLGVDAFHPELAGFTATPAFGGLGHKRALLCDGVYGPPKALAGASEAAIGSPLHRKALSSVATMVTLGTLGVPADTISENRPRMRHVIDYVVDHHRTPPFPGTIDASLAEAGAAVFGARCASCHGDYAPDPSGQLPWRLVAWPEVAVPVDAIGTDPTRAALVSPALAKRLNASPLGELLHAESTGSYVAVPLSGLWATAPYLHNGSVPTVWHLMHPESRPVRFEVGGHALDHVRLGIRGEPDGEGGWRYLASHTPWTLPETYDTRTPGRGNGGHEHLFEGLSEADKASLLEHLKRL